MHFGFKPGRRQMDVLYIVKILQEEYLQKNRKLYLCFVDLEKAFDRVSRKVVEWSLQIKGAPEVVMKAVMSLYVGATTKVRVGYVVSDKFFVKVSSNPGSAVSSFWFALVTEDTSKELCVT